MPIGHRVWTASLVIAVVIACTNCSAPDAIGYRLTAEISVDGVRYTGTSVVETDVSDRGFGIGPPEKSKTTGEAVVVDVPGRSSVFFLLRDDSTPDWAMLLPFGAFYGLLPNPLQGADDPSNRRALATGSWSTDLPLADYPMIVAFRDPLAPSSVYELRPEDLSPATGGKDAHVVRLSVTLTHDSPNLDIETRLPWLRGYGTNLNGKSVTSGRSAAEVTTTNDFIKREQ